MKRFDLRADQLTPGQLHDVLRLRTDVFVVEQNCAYAELDGRDLDAGTRHVWLEDDAGIAAYLRIVGNDGSRRIGRVVTRTDRRGRGLAAALLTSVVADGKGPFTLESQSHLLDFYARLGFVVCGDEYVEDGIPHRPMRLESGRTLPRKSGISAGGETATTSPAGTTPSTTTTETNT